MQNRTFVRAQGCWNCVHSGDAKEFWTKRRMEVLQRAVVIAGESPRGEADQRVMNIRRMVNLADHGVVQGQMIRCTKGKMANGEPVGDLTAYNFLCDRWTARDGASVAREGGKLDKLPEELRWEVDGDAPMSVSKLARELEDK